MANRIVMVSVAPYSPLFQSIWGDQIAAQIGDWIRVNSNTWLIWTTQNTSSVSNTFRSSLNPNDTIVVVYVDPKGAAGNAPQWIWDWVNSKANVNAGLGAVFNSIPRLNP
jgi:hypothetical protein